MRAVVNSLHMPPGYWFGRVQDRLISAPLRTLLLQSRVISRRRRHGRWRGIGRHQQSPAAEGDGRDNDKAYVKSFHVVSPGVARAHAVRHEANSRQIIAFSWQLSE